jgi:hypothetical protein
LNTIPALHASRYILIATIKERSDTLKVPNRIKVKIKQSRYRPEQGQRVDRGTALPSHNLGARMGYVVNITPRPLYPREKPGTHCTGGWVGPGPVWTSAKNLAPNGIPSPDRPARSQSLYRLSYRGPRIELLNTQFKYDRWSDIPKQNTRFFAYR